MAIKSNCSPKQACKTARSLLATLVAGTCTTIVGPAPVYAGSGTFTSGVHDFCVSVRFSATADQLQKIRAAFQNGSQVLADATDGQHRFGKIRIVNNSGASNAAEYWINPGAGRAFATYSKYGVRGEHVNLFFASDFLSVNAGPDGDAYTIAHEHSHHSYGVGDEYAGPLGPAESAPASAESPTLNYSLMDNYFTRGGRAFGGGYTLNEFDVASNFDPDRNTFQFSINGKSVWETIAAHPTRSAIIPVGLPIDAPPAPQTVTFADSVGDLKIALSIDRSGSMGAVDSGSTQSRLALAKDGANQFVNLLSNGNGLAVTSFSDSATVNFALTTITSSATKSSAQSSINALVDDGSTNIGGGLLAALGQITSQPNRSCNEVITLLSDGDQNTGTTPESVIPQLKSEGVTVLTVGIGGGISSSGQSSLQNIANQTGGKYYRVNNSSDLALLFLQISAETTGTGVLAQAPQNTIGAGQSVELAQIVEDGLDSATFAITKVDANSDLTLTLRTPSGDIINSLTLGVEAFSSSSSSILRVANPQPGSWKTVVTNNGAGSTNFGNITLAKHDGVGLTLQPFKNAVTYPEPVILSATPTFDGKAVVRATLNGRAIRPDGSVVPLVYFDDGLPEHGDAAPNDGIYSIKFNSYNANGTYIFEAQSQTQSKGAHTFAGESLFQSQPSNEKTVPNFVRLSSSTAVVTGVPQITAPVITSFSPSNGPVGTVVTLIGSGFTGTTSVRFYQNIPASFTVLSDTQMTTTVPPGAANGTLRVDNPSGRTTTARKFQVTAP